MQNYYQFLIPRMNGDALPGDFMKYRRLVRKGIGGFIVFGGELREVRRHIRLLQEEARHTLIIASDLERGLGQQLRGGTHFPPAMAFSKAAGAGFGRQGLARVRAAFGAVAEEASYAGINTVFAPVLDINTNPRNPIIAARAFGEDSAAVSLMGSEMIKAFRKRGIAACGKHFPGHGDTRTDSHIKLPVIKRSLPSLQRRELVPFQRAMDEGVPMIMLGHLSVPGLDPSGRPMTLSDRAVSFIRKRMGYDGILITDAMNMGGLAGYSEEEACLRALEAGVDVILHPLDPDRVAARLKEEGIGYDASRLNQFRERLSGRPASRRPEFGLHRRIAADITRRSIRSEGPHRMRDPFVVVLNDDDRPAGRFFLGLMKKYLPRLRYVVVGRGESLAGSLPPGVSPLVAVFSETRGWKGGAGAWLFKTMAVFDRRDAVIVSFGSPYILDSLKRASKIYAYWDGETAQEAVADLMADAARAPS